MRKSIQVDPLANLPVEVFEEITRLLPERDLRQLAQVNVMYCRYVNQLPYWNQWDPITADEFTVADWRNHRMPPPRDGLVQFCGLRCGSKLRCDAERAFTISALPFSDHANKVNDRPYIDGSDGDGDYRFVTDISRDNKLGAFDVRSFEIPAGLYRMALRRAVLTYLYKRIENRAYYIFGHNTKRRDIELIAILEQRKKNDRVHIDRARRALRLFHYIGGVKGAKYIVSAAQYSWAREQI